MPNPAYSVVLSNAAFTSPDASGITRGDFRFTLFINSDAQAQLSLSVEAANSSVLGLIKQAQGELATAMQGWAANLSNS